MEEIKNNPELKKKFINGLNKLGFPLEFKIRQKLKRKNYSAQEGFFTDKEAGQEVTRSFDINAHRNENKIILKNLTIRMELLLIGDCKFSNDQNKFLFAIPDTSNPANKLFVCPLLTNFQSARYGIYRNSELTSNFVSKFGGLFISSDIKDTAKNNILDEKEEDESKSKTPPYEKIFNIVESTILPATKEKFMLWRSCAYQDYSRELRAFTRSIPVNEFIDAQENGFYAGKLIIPFIVTSKPIIKPILNEKDEVTDIEFIPFTLYEHSVRKPEDYLEILGQCYDIGIFVCNERFFDDFLVYIESLFSKISGEILNNLNQHLFRLIDDFEDIKRQNEEIQEARKRKTS